MTHKKIDAIPDDMYIPLQVGRAGKQSFGYTGDNTGDNISAKNPMYCELTGIYWLWKNIDCDVIGICHYRRYFTRAGKLLGKAYIERTVRQYPIIIPNSSCVDEDDVYAHYAKRHYAKDLDLCREVIAEKYPKYLAAFDYAMQTILVSVGNIWITKKDIFNRYCRWLFDILFEVENRIDLRDYDDYQKRVIGFLAERLFRVWLFMQPEAITEENVQMAEVADFLREEKQNALLHRYVRLKMEPVIRFYQGTHETFVRPFSCKDNFDGKIPLWVCWWQGETRMPDLVRCCLQSMKNNLLSDKMVFRLITFENCLEYVTFTEQIIRKFNEGKISDSDLLSILMAELLFRYGGMWISADYFVTKPLDMEIFEHKMYTLKDPEVTQVGDVTNRRSSGLWFVQKGTKLFEFVTESLWYYWELEERWIEGAFVDAIIAAAAEEIPEIAQEMASCGFEEGEVLELSQWMNRKYSKERMERLMGENAFYKLDWRENYRKENMAGEKTVYGELIGICDIGVWYSGIY